MASILISIAAKIVEYPVQPILRQFDYLIDFKRNLRNLSEKAEKLKSRQDQVNQEVKRATRTGDVIEPEAKRWLENVDKIIEEVRKIEDESKIKKNCFGGWCPNCLYRYRVSRKSTKKVNSIAELQGKCKFDRVSHPAPLPGIEYFSSDGIIAFESRTATMDQILHFLEEDESSVVVVHGNRGLGKTTLAKEVGKTANKRNMFDEVVMADVSKTPDNHSIQGQLADLLGLKLQEASDSGRARRLWMRLKNENKKVLIILDGVKERPDLEAIGIPSALDHKGCKILVTTENENMGRAMGDGVKKVELKALLEEESWRLFKSTTGEIVETPSFKGVAEEIVGKCKGLPLMIVTIGKKLKNKRIEEWKDESRQIGYLEKNKANLDDMLDDYV